MGDICPTAIFVAMNDAPQTMTANRASKIGDEFCFLHVPLAVKN
jgi:hypothetical protein